MRLVDLTQTFTAEMPVFPGDAKSELKCISQISQTGFTDHHLSTNMHVGTHIDAPLHMIENGSYLTEFDVDSFFGRGVLINACGCSDIDVELLAGIEIKKGDIVLVMTGFSQFFTDPKYYTAYPVFTHGFADRLVEMQIKMVGIDTPSPDRAPYKVHKILLSKNILILENLTNLAALSAEKFEVIALPIKLKSDAAAARVVARCS